MSAADRTLPCLTGQPAPLVEIRGDLVLAWRRSEGRLPLPPTWDELLADLAELEVAGRARTVPGAGWALVPAAEVAA